MVAMIPAPRQRYPMKTRQQKAQTSRGQYTHSSIRVIEGGGRHGEASQPFNYDRAVAEFRSWVWSAVQINANSIASLPLRLYVKKRPGLKAWKTRPVSTRRKRFLLGDLNDRPHRTTVNKLVEFGDDFEEVTDTHPVLELLRKVNPWYNGFDLLQLLVMYLELTGNGYLHPVHDQTSGLPVEVWPMPSQWTWVIPDRDEFISGYSYGQTYQQRDVVYEPDEVIHFRTANPSSLYYGMGKVEAGWGVVQTNAATHEMDLAMAANHARPDYVMTVKSGANGDQLDRFEKKVERKLKGAGKAGSMLSISGDVTLTPLNFPPKDLAGREDMVEEIASVFGVPVTMLKANDPNLASAQVGHIGHARYTILPLARLIEQKLNESLVPLFGIEGDAILAFDNPVPDDRQFELSESTALVGAGVRTINEDRSIRGDEPVEGGDVPRINGQSLETLDREPVSPFTLNMQNEKPPQAVAAAVQPDAAAIARQTGEAVGKTVAEQLGKLIQELQQKATSDAGSKEANTDTDSAGHLQRERHTCAEDGRQPATADGRNKGNGAVQDAGQQSNECAVECKCHCGDDIKQASGQGVDGTHLAYMPVSFKSWLPLTKADADTDIRDGEPDSPTDQLARVLNDHFAEQLQLVEQFVAKTKAGEPRRRKMSKSDLAKLDGLMDSVNDRLLERVQPITERMALTGVQAGLERIDVAAAFDVTNPAVAEAVEAFNLRLVGEINQTTTDRIKHTLSEGIDAGEALTELTDRVRASFGVEDGTFPRANVIARTESARAYIEGQEVGWQESGVVEGKQWLLAPNACEFCKAAAAQFGEGQQTVGLGEPFFKRGTTLTGTDGGTMPLNYTDVTGPPLHPNDRCDVVAVLKEQQ